MPLVVLRLLRHDRPAAALDRFRKIQISSDIVGIHVRYEIAVIALATEQLELAGLALAGMPGGAAERFEKIQALQRAYDNAVANPIDPEFRALWEPVG